MNIIQILICCIGIIFLGAIAIILSILAVYTIYLFIKTIIQKEKKE